VKWRELYDLMWCKEVEILTMVKGVVHN